MATRFDHHRPTPGQQVFHERVDVLLQQWFATGHFDQRASVSIDVADDIVEGTVRPS